MELSIGAFCTEFGCEQLCDDDTFFGIWAANYGMACLGLPLPRGRIRVPDDPPEVTRRKKNGVPPLKKRMGSPGLFFLTFYGVTLQKKMGCWLRGMQKAREWSREPETGAVLDRIEPWKSVGS